MKLHSIVLSMLLFTTSAFASETNTEEHQIEEHQEEALNYIALKGMYTFGDTYTNEGAIEEGSDGYGVAVDLGHRIGYGFAVEIDLSYESSDVTAVEEGGESFTETVSYYTTSIDLAYVYELTHSVGVFAKIGYEYEYEEVADTSSNDTGFIFAGGMEYALNHTYKLLVEYEKSTIDGPKGDMIYTGIMYNF